MAGQTSIYQLDYPTSTDLVTAGASAMQTLAGDVESVLQLQTAAMSTGYRNHVRNSTFTQNQRPAVTTSVADFWVYYTDSIVGVTNTRNTLAATAGLPEWVAGSMTQANSTAGTTTRYVALQQTIPDVRSLANQTVLVSFYAKAATGTPKVGVNLTQTFGTGGAPSADVVGNGTAVTISTAWARYSVTLTTASVVGKTLGTAGNDGTILRLWTNAGSNNATPSGSVGNQTATIDITGVQVERSYLTPLETNSVDSNWLAASNFATFDGWTPQLKQGAAGLTTTVNYAGYVVLGRFCFAHCTVTAGANGTAGQNLQILSNGTLPAPKQYNGVNGHLLYDDVGTGLNWYAARPISSVGTPPTWQFYLNGGAGAVTTPTISSAGPDLAYFQTWYEIA